MVFRCVNNMTQRRVRPANICGENEKGKRENWNSGLPGRYLCHKIPTGETGEEDFPLAIRGECSRFFFTDLNR